MYFGPTTRAHLHFTAPAKSSGSLKALWKLLHSTLSTLHPCAKLVLPLTCTKNVPARAFLFRPDWNERIHYIYNVCIWLREALLLSLRINTIASILRLYNEHYCPQRPYFCHYVLHEVLWKVTYCISPMSEYFILAMNQFINLVQTLVQTTACASSSS